MIRSLLVLIALILIGRSFAADCAGMNSSACQMFQKINAERIKRSIPTLMPSSRCVRAAQEHAQDMFKRKYFSHHSPNETFTERMQRWKFSGSYAENISRAPDKDRVLSGWMNSTGHRRNILNSKYIYSGIGQVDRLWVQCFTSKN